MKNKTIFVWVALSILLSLEVHTQTADVLWTTRIHSNKWNWGLYARSAIDPAGHVVVAGFFQGSVSFGQTNLIGSNLINTFLAKYDAQGNLIWARATSSEQHYIYSSGLAIDRSGNIYLSAGKDLVGGGGSEVLLAKFDSGGALLWSKNISDIRSTWDNPNLLALDSHSNIYMAGESGVYEELFSSLFVIKLDANGNELWRQASPASPSGSSVIPKGVAVDEKGNCAVVGWFAYSGPPTALRPSLDFGSVTLTNAGYGDVFTAKYDSNGNLLWATSLGTQSLDIGKSVVIDPSGEVYVTGYLGGVVNFPDQHFFLAKYGTTGNLIWLKKSTGLGLSEGRDIFLMGDGNVLVSGSLHEVGNQNSSLRLDSIALTAPPRSNLIFLLGFDSRGNLTIASELFRSDTTIIDTYRQTGYMGYADLAVDPNGNIYYTDVFTSTNSSNARTLDIVLAKISGSSLGPKLHISRSGDRPVLTWPSAFSSFALESTATLSPAATWVGTAATPVTIGNQQTVVLDAEASAHFYRLRKP